MSEVTEFEVPMIEVLNRKYEIPTGDTREEILDQLNESVSDVQFFTSKTGNIGWWPKMVGETPEHSVLDHIDSRDDLPKRLRKMMLGGIVTISAGYSRRLREKCHFIYMTGSYVHPGRDLLWSNRVAEIPRSGCDWVSLVDAMMMLVELFELFPICEEFNPSICLDRDLVVRNRKKLKRSKHPFTHDSHGRRICRYSDFKEWILEQ